MRAERIHLLNDAPVREGRYVVYRMQASQRIQGNLALCRAAQLANDLELPLLVLFCLDANYPEANYRHFKFMIDGLMECESVATSLGIGFELTDQGEDQLFSLYFKEAAAIICDQGYSRKQREWKVVRTQNIACRMESIEDNLIVPIASASNKAEWSARTIRPKLMEKMPYFMDDADYRLPVLKHPYPGSEKHNREVRDRFLDSVRQQRYLSPVDVPSGEKAAHALLNEFIESKLVHYDLDRNDPSLAATSRLSAHLHFGQISPLQILRKVDSLPEAATFTEQLLVRRELAHNFIYYTPQYDSYMAIPSWCRRTLESHRSDSRPYLYRGEELENAETAAPYWNAAMKEMRETGYMENTMRMYWGKKIIEWSRSPEEAYSVILELNNRYFLDGRDANSYAGVGWCFGLHDRPWPSHPIFGTVRIMTSQGLERKYDMARYIQRFLTTH